MSQHSDDAERAVLGGLMLDPRQLGAIGLLLDAEDFFRPKHGALFTFLLEMDRAGLPVEMLSVVERMVKLKRVGELGGINYVSQLGDQSPSTENLAHYAGIVRDYAEVRRLMAHIREIGQEMTAGKLTPASARERLLDVSTKGRAPKNSAVIGDVVGEVEADLDAEVRGDREVFMPTGIQCLDSAHDFGGLTTQGVTLIIGASGMGKTSLLNRWALGIANRGTWVYLYGTETGMKRRSRDLAFSLAGVDQRKWASNNQLRNERQHPPAALIEWIQRARRRLHHANIKLAELPLIVNNAGRSVDEVGAEIRQYHREGRCGIAFADYLQDFVASGAVASDSGSQTVYASRILKELASQLCIPVVVGAQRTGEQELNGQLAGATERTIAGLVNRLIPNQVQWSSRAKHDAEEVFSLYRRDYYADLYPHIEPYLPGREGHITIVARKRRAGPLARWEMPFTGPTKWVGDRPRDMAF